jgi:hypothetical protein
MLVIGIASRLVPHYPNFTAVGAVSLFAAAFGGRRSVAVIIPYLVMLLSDLILNNIIYARAYPADYAGFIFLYRGALWSYAAFGLIVMFGYTLFKRGVDFFQSHFWCIRSIHHILPSFQFRSLGCDQCIPDFFRRIIDLLCSRSSVLIKPGIR